MLPRSAASLAPGHILKSNLPRDDQDATSSGARSARVADRPNRGRTNHRERSGRSVDSRCFVRSNAGVVHTADKPGEEVRRSDQRESSSHLWGEPGTARGSAMPSAQHQTISGAGIAGRILPHRRHGPCPQRITKGQSLSPHGGTESLVGDGFDCRACQT